MDRRAWQGGAEAVGLLMNKRPVILTVHRNTRDRRERHWISERMLSCAREAASKKNIDGFVVFTYRRSRDEDGRPMLSTDAHYSTRDPTEIPGLPDLVRFELLRRVVE